jgi:5-formyltetrahydrofolate cyclo-ligase
VVTEAADDIALVKAALRRTALAARDAADPRRGLWLAAHVLAECPPPPGAVVAGFWPMGAEIDIRPLLLALQGRGHTLALPVTPRRGHPLAFRAWRFGAALVPGPFGTRQPAPEAPPIIPDFLLVPLLAFDARGHRLGYGGGYYDRTLAALPFAAALGIAFASQRLPLVPTGPTDIPLPRIATEAGIILSEA